MIDRIGVQPVVVSASQGMARQTYRVIEVGDGGAVSNEVGCTNDLSVDGNCNYVHWSSDAEGPFRVERSTGGMFEEIAEASDHFHMDAG